VKTGQEIVRLSSDDEPLAMLAFKIIEDPFGILTFARVYSGHVQKGVSLLNSTKERKERVGRMVLMHADSREEIEEAYAGDIVALVGLKDTRTGDTLCDPLKPVILERMEFPAPVIEMAVEAASKADQEKLGVALSKLAGEDPSFSVSTDQESGQTIIKGMGELHLDIKIDILKRAPYNVNVTVGAPQVAYRETIRKPAEIDYTHKKQTGGTGQFARVKFAIEPNTAGAGFEFENKVVGGSVPREYVPAVEKGLKSVMTSGPVAGFPVVDVKVQLIDGAYHEVDSSTIAFEIAARAAFREGLQRANPVLLEPIMKVEVVTPDDYTGVVTGDLTARRGHLEGQISRGGTQIITAYVPLSNMFGYSTDLRSRTQGRATYTMHFEKYAEAPRNVSEEVVAKVMGKVER
jgi:elongation factor G